MWRWRVELLPTENELKNETTIAHQQESALFLLQYIQNMKDKLNDAIAFPLWIQCDNFRSSSNANPKSRMSQKIHYEQEGGRTSSLETLCSTPLRREKNSLRSSLMSKCNRSICVAICSTALVSRITASRASVFRRVNPMAPIAATEIEAPATAATISIIGSKRQDYPTGLDRETTCVIRVACYERRCPAESF